MADSIQHKLDRVRRPRVQITYDVELEGAMVKEDLPFVVGVMADLSGNPAVPSKSLKERKFVQVDRDNITKVFLRAQPQVAMKVKNLLKSHDGDPDELPVLLDFAAKDKDPDKPRFGLVTQYFEPADVAMQIKELAELLEIRQSLSQLLNKMQGNEDLEGRLTKLLADPPKAKALVDGLKANGQPPLPTSAAVAPPVLSPAPPPSTGPDPAAPAAPGPEAGPEHH